MTTPDDTKKFLVAGRYRLDRRIGSGGMGVVWEATDEKLRRTVAIKELLAIVEPRLDPDGRSFDEARDRIQREARIAARLQHPNVISIYDVALHDNRPWLVMEYMPSHSLDAVLADRGPLSPREVAEIGRQAAAGLAAAHGVGVVHRDIKPGNVLLADDGSVKIVDFGVSRAADEVQLTRTGLISGTPAYLAPEVARGQTPTPASDVFALGATLYSAVEGEPPFGLSDNAFALLHTVAGGNVRPPRNAGPLTAVLMRLLRADPAERPTAQQAQNELAMIPGGAPISGVDANRSTTARGPQHPPATAHDWPAGPRQDPADPGHDGPPGQAQGRPDSAAQEPTVAVAGPVAGAFLDAARSDPARSDPARSDPARPDPARPDPPRSGPARSGPARFGPAGGSTRFDMPAAPPARPATSSRRRSVLIVVGTVVAVLAVAAVILVMVRNTDGGQGTVAAPPATSPAAPAPTAAAAAAAPTPAAPAVNNPSGVAFVQQYYALLPGNVDAAWQLLGPTAQSQSGGFAGFRNFYARMTAVDITNGPTAVDASTVRATIRFTESNGSTTQDVYEFTVAPGPDGNPRIQSFRRVGPAG